MNKILLIDEDPKFLHELGHYLHQEGFDIATSTEGDVGLKKAMNQTFDLIILDIVLPNLNGFQVLKQLRAHSSIPVIFLTSRYAKIDHIVGFELGVDDYILKPCNPHELLGRIHALLKRADKVATSKPLLQYGPIIVDCKHRTVKLDNLFIELTNTEFNILEILVKSSGQAFSKEELTEYAMGRKFTAYDRSIDVHISNLRSKLGSNAQGEDWIKTVRGFGYTFNQGF